MSVNQSVILNILFCFNLSDQIKINYDINKKILKIKTSDMVDEFNENLNPPNINLYIAIEAL